MRKAVIDDIDPIMEITYETIKIMSIEGNPQWDENYPARADFIDDIAAGNLFVCCDGADILGMACINMDEPPEYEALSWELPSPATVIHRMAVHPRSRGRGVACAFMKFAEDVARANGTRYLKGDTYYSNIKMNSLFYKCGFTARGRVRFYDKPGGFNCYDKTVD